jgi:NADH:ubiquinone oxidoreductase subunit 4 (subunit M)
MDRPQRIRLVAALGMMIAGLLVAVFGGPLVAVLVVESSPFPSDVAGFQSHMQAMTQASRIATWCFLLGMTAAIVSGVYSLISIASWFIGPASKTDASQPS